MRHENHVSINWDQLPSSVTLFVLYFTNSESGQIIVNIVDLNKK